MPKKQRVPNVESVVLTPYCQHCKFQSNNPSFCSVKDKHIPRKAKVCDKFKK